MVKSRKKTGAPRKQEGKRMKAEGEDPVEDGVILADNRKYTYHKLFKCQ